MLQLHEREGSAKPQLVNVDLEENCWEVSLFSNYFH